MSATEQFRDAIAHAGIPAPDQIIDDGKIHRFATSNRRSDDSGWYLFHPGDRPAGAFGCWRSGLTQKWRADRVTPYVRQAPAPKPHQAPDTARYGRCAWDGACRDDAVVAGHSYAIRKGINHAAGAGRGRISGRRIGRNADCILVPIRENGIGHVSAVQAISAHGEKQTFGTMGEAFLLLGNEHDPEARWLVTEGWATACALLNAWQRTVLLVAFGQGRLESVAAIASSLFQPAEIIIAGEDDAQ